MYIEPVNPYDTDHNKEVVRRLSGWFSALPPEDVENGQYNAAIDSVNNAILATVKYQRRLKDGIARDANIENELSQLWNTASSRIRLHDTDLGYFCMVKSQGWADSDMWDRPDYKEQPLLLEQITRRLKNLTDRKPFGSSPVPAWFPIAGVIFAGFTVISLFVLIITPIPLDPSKHFLVDIWMAFCVAASTAFLTGTASAKGKLPWIKDSPIEISAVGGIGVFVVVFIIMYKAFP